MRKFALLWVGCISLLLSGCNLDITIEGSGRVYSTDGTLNCTTNCQNTNKGLPVTRTLVAEPADGFTFLGFMPDGDAQASVNYGFVPYTVYGTTPRYFVNVNASVLAVFFPTDQIAQRESSSIGTCVVDTMQHMTCWGEGAKLHPSGLDNVNQLERHGYTFCAYYDNRISCWNDYQPYNNTVPDYVLNPLDVAYNNASTCVLYDGAEGHQIFCLGDSAPPSELNNPTAIWSDGDDAYCATHAAGTLCWGDGYFGQSHVPDDLANVSDFATGAFHTCAIASGEVQCWGRNDSGQLDVPADLINPTALVAGTNATCAIANGQLRCWGGEKTTLTLDAPALFDPALFDLNHVIGCLVDPGHAPQLRCPLAATGVATPTLGNITALATGVNTVCAVSDNNLLCWGLADITKTTLNVTDTPYLLSSFDDSVCAATNTGLQCFSVRDNYHLKTPPATLTHPTSMALQSYHGCAVQNGTVSCWGDGAATGTLTTIAKGQGAVPAGLSNIRKVDVGQFHSCALSNSGQLTCWGETPVPQP